MNQLRPISKCLALAFGGSLVLASTSLYAQTGAPAQKQERIEVTGSNIKRVDIETAAPVQIITRDQIERSGATSVSELLQTLPSNNAGMFNENAVASFSPGAASVSLRGLGAQATLVLLNGRRITPFGFASGGQTTFVDLNSIPLDAIERLDVLLDGASALYGSEAMAGVVNIILRKDFTGFEGRLGGGISSHGDAKAAKAGGTFGIGSLAQDKYNFFGSIEASKRDPVLANARDATKNSDFRRLGTVDRRSTYSYPGNIYGASNTTASFISPLNGCSPLVDSTAPVNNGRCIYDFTDHTDLVSKSERLAFLGAGTIQVSENTQLFGDLSLTKNRFAQRSASYSPANYFANPALILPVGHPQNTTAGPLSVRYRLADVERVTEVESSTQRLVLGARGTWFGWDAESGLLYSGSNTDVRYKGLIRDSVFYNEVLDPNSATGREVQKTFILGNPSANDPGLMSRLYPVLKENGKTSISSIDLKGSRDLMQLSGGTLGLAVGLEARRESFKSVPDPLVEAGEIGVLGSSSSDGSRTVKAVYAELAAPLLPSLEAQLAIRSDNYSDFGNATTPKFGIKWRPAKNFALRGTYAEGFRAPALTELVQSPTRGFYSNVRDPKLCPDPADTTNPNCALSIPGISGSNPNLKPEKSKSFTAGFVFDLTDNVSIAVDWYDIKRTNEIAALDVEYLLANESLYPGYVVRNPPVAPATVGTINQLLLPYSNLGSTHVKGLDFDIKTKFKLAESGQLGIQATYNILPTYNVKPVADAEELNYAGTWLQPKERAKLAWTWETGPWAFNWTTNYVGGYLRAFTPSDLSCPYTNTRPSLCKVDSWATNDIGITYRGFKNLQIVATVNNIENRDAPLDQRRETRYTWYNSTFHNALGRYYQLNLKYSFK